MPMETQARAEAEKRDPGPARRSPFRPFGATLAGAGLAALVLAVGGGCADADGRGSDGRGEVAELRAPADETGSGRRGATLSLEPPGESEPGASPSAPGLGAPGRTLGAPPGTPGAAAPAARPRDAANQDASSSRRTSIVEAARRVSPAVVSVNVIRTQRARGRSLWEQFFLPPGGRRVPGLGSGFIYDVSGSEALVVTNEHVIRNADRIKVTLPDGRDFDATLLGADEVSDVAVLRIEGEEFPVAPLGTSDGLLIGEWTVAIGNPFGFLLSNAEPTVTAGVVSAVGRHILPSDDDDGGVYLGMIQTDAPINPGNSGGPLVNALGEVIGMNTSIFSRSGGSQGMGFAIPVDRAVRIGFDLVRFGEVRRAWTGIDVEPVEADAWGRTRGVRISRVLPGSPGDEAGLEEGERILGAQGRRLANPLDLEALLLDIRAGEEVEVEVEGRSSPVRIETEALPSLRAERVRVLEELELISVTPEIRAEREVASEAGALIVEISPRLQRQLGLGPGDVIVQINNTRVRDAREAARELRRVAGSGAVRLYFERDGGLAVRTFSWR